MGFLQTDKRVQVSGINCVLQKLRISYIRVDSCRMSKERNALTHNVKRNLIKEATSDVYNVVIKI